MLIKEYRIPLPMSVDEYRIAQLYMIQKKSRLESEGRDCGVEIIENHPYEGGPGGSGQFTRKVYHINRILPAFLRSILPKQFSPQAHEEAWNAYPYTKTRYTAPFMEKFYIDIETVYHPDPGTQDNVFNLSEDELRQRTVDLVDVVKDPMPAHEYLKEEDPKVFVSEKTKRGPLSVQWLEEYVSNPRKGPIMCAYKLCRVEFKYWGVQSKTEKFIYDVAMRKTMLRAHRQAWCWQDEYHGLTIADIRRLERETQLALAAKMGSQDENAPPSGPLLSVSTPSVTVNSRRNSTVLSAESAPAGNINNGPVLERSRSGSKQSFHSPTGSFAQDNWVLEGLRTDLDDGSDDEFFDAAETFNEPEETKAKPLVRWSSMELTEDDEPVSAQHRQIAKEDSIFSASFKSDSNRLRLVLTQPPRSLPGAADAQPASGEAEVVEEVCRTSVLLIVFHGGSILDNGSTIDLTGNRADISTFTSCIDTVINAHYPALHGHVQVKNVRCPPICGEALTVLSSLTPYSLDLPSSTSDPSTPTAAQDFTHLSALPLFATSNPAYRDIITKVVKKANQTYEDFLKTPEGKHYKGPVYIAADGTAGLLVYDALCRYGTNEGSLSSLSSERNETTTVPPDTAKTTATSARPSLRPTMHPASRSLSNPGTGVSSTPMAINAGTVPTFAPLNDAGRYLSAPVVDKIGGRRASDNSDTSIRFEFDVGDVFLFGCPLGLVLAYRKCMENVDDKFGPPLRPWCAQLFNLFHPTDPSALRIEPLLSAKFSFIKPVSVPRYQKFPLGDGRSYYLYEHIQNSRHLFEDTPRPAYDLNETINDAVFHHDHSPFSLNTVSHITRNWWGSKRIDYALYCPEGTSQFPVCALPHLFHASFWESLDVVAFIIRQIFQPDNIFHSEDDNAFRLGFSSQRPTEKWLRRRTSIKLKNMHPNHRGNDVVVGENCEQALSARFMYGPFDMLTLTGEKVDVYIMTQPPSGEWVLFGTEITSSQGRVTFTVPHDKKLGLGLYPVKMIVRGDHTSVDFYLAIVPAKTECMVFSIDGSFTASVSVTGRDPKVRPGAVDIVRHWQELGYLIIYITGRPDMQHQAVVNWLAHHNFPHGMVQFCDGLVADPLRQKTNYLRALIEEAGVIIHAAYGSSKDIQVYGAVGLKPDQIYCIGKASKKLQDRATMLTEGYAAHLNALSVPGGSRPAQGNGRMIIRRGNFSLPTPSSAPEVRRHKSMQKSFRGTATVASHLPPESPPPSSGGSTSSPYTPRFSFKTPETSPKDDSVSLKGSLGGTTKRKGFFSRF
ncbi:protein retinal degeneration B-like [Paramacrobiotus metropolitanus]|uniref:protein retinal degeneration B-like n=1 Tax=Paramacrobiotus metropolitanus TaxID=2943436 RepID=UPI0024464EB3|nr:protein retinal degeneration B-like [Paramacrobiotus metropolitanus]XP_055327533.1 protein retinal degeneration B-like [Paramacrobiotus metropolitanus]XP_055327534.1 protein retinal degeneration B-like [Paramacrobiotus metropolitanus]